MLEGIRIMNFCFDSFSMSGLILDGLIVATFCVFFLFLRRRGDWISLLGSFSATAALWCSIGLPAEGMFFAARALWTIASVALPLGMILLWLQRRRAFWELARYCCCYSNFMEKSLNRAVWK